MIPITGSMLYSYALCPHRVTLDLFGDPEKRDEHQDFCQSPEDAEKPAIEVLFHVLPVKNEIFKTLYRPRRYRRKRG